MHSTLCMFLFYLTCLSTPTLADQSSGGGRTSAKPLTDDSEFYNPIPGDVLSKKQKARLCTVPRVKELCAVAGTTDDTCTTLSSSLNGTNPQCDVRHVCSFEMTEGNVPALNTTLAPHPAPSKNNEIVDLPRASNRAYVTQENLDDLYIVKECENNSLLVFVPEKIDLRY